MVVNPEGYYRTRAYMLEFVLLLTMYNVTISRATRARDITKFHVQLCIAMLAMLIAFLVGVDRTENEVACTFMSCVIQYFALSSLCWMGAEAVFMYKQLVFVFGRLTFKFMFITSMISWGNSCYYSNAFKVVILTMNCRSANDICHHCAVHAGY